MVALATFPIYVSGLILRTLGEAFHPSALAFAAGLAGATLEIIAILTFGWIIAETLLAPTARRSASDRYILAATFWFAAQAVYDVFLFWLTSTAGSTEEFVRRIATFQPPLRDIQVHGFAALMILGASQRYLPGMIGLGRVPENSRTSSSSSSTRRSSGKPPVTWGGVSGSGLLLLGPRSIGRGLHGRKRLPRRSPSSRGWDSPRSTGSSERRSPARSRSARPAL